MCRIGLLAVFAIVLTVQKNWSQQGFEFLAGTIEPFGGYQENRKETFLYKERDNFFDVRYVQKRATKKRMLYSFGLLNRSDNFIMDAHNGSYAPWGKTTIHYKNRLTTLYGGLRWQFPISRSKFWLANQIDFGFNYYRNDVKLYLKPHDNDFMETDTGPYFLEVTHRGHLKFSLRNEVLLGYKLSNKINLLLNFSVPWPLFVEYKIQRSPAFGDYFEEFYSSSYYLQYRGVGFFQFQIGLGIQYQLSQHEKK